MPSTSKRLLTRLSALMFQEDGKPVKFDKEWTPEVLRKIRRLMWNADVSGDATRDARLRAEGMMLAAKHVGSKARRRNSQELMATAWELRTAADAIRGGKVVATVESALPPIEEEQPPFGRSLADKHGMDKAMATLKRCLDEKSDD